MCSFRSSNFGDVGKTQWNHMKPTNFRHWFGWKKTPQHQPHGSYRYPGASEGFVQANYRHLKIATRHMTYLPGRLTNVPWKPMVGSDVVSYWNSPFWGAFVSFRGCNHTKIVSRKGGKTHFIFSTWFGEDMFSNRLPKHLKCLRRGLIENSTEGSIYLLLDSRMWEHCLFADGGGDSVYMKWSQSDQVVVSNLVDVQLEKCGDFFLAARISPKRRAKLWFYLMDIFEQNIGCVLYLPPTQDSSGK